MEFAAAALTLLGVLTFGMLEGILIGAGFSVLGLIWRISNPRTAILGRIPGTNQFGDLARHPENERLPGVVIFRVDDAIVYPNVGAVKAAVLAEVESAQPPARLVVLDMANTPILDLAGIDMLAELNTDITDRGATLRLAGTTGDVRDALRAAGVTKNLGPLEAGATVERVIETSEEAGSPAGPPDRHGPSSSDPAADGNGRS